MPDDLATLELERSRILEPFLSLSDLRPGSMTAVIRRCGKPSCHCAKPHDPPTIHSSASLGDSRAKL